MGFCRFLFRNLPLKIIALVVAAIVWFYAVLERAQTSTMDLPITLGKIPVGMLVASIDTPRARAQLAGKGRDLMLLRLRKPAFRLNLTTENPGRVRVKLDQDQSNLPAGVQVVSAKPEYVSVDLDQQARRLVKVAIPTRGKPAEGYVVTSVKSLDNVYLSGPQEEIGLTTTVAAESLSVAGLSSNTQRRVQVMPPAGKRFHTDPESVNVAVRIEPEENRVFPAVTISVFKSTVRTVLVKPARAQITVSGAADAVRALDLQDIAATLKITDTLPKGKYELPCEIALPSGITLVKCDPPVFEVDVK